MYMRLYDPVLLTLKDSGTETLSTNTAGNLARFFTLLLVFILVLALTYFTTRFVANSKRGSVSSGNMEVLETVMLAGGKYLQLVRAGKHYIVLAVGKEQIQKVAELSEEEYIKQKKAEGGAFSSILDRVRKLNGSAAEGQDEETEKGTEDDEA